MTTVCRVCLSSDAPMHIILTDSPLQTIYGKLINNSINMKHGPVLACYICYYQLKKCYNLMARCVRADKVMSQILRSGQVKEESVAILQHEAYQHALSMTPVEVINITGTDNDLVKIENNEESLLSQGHEESEMDGPEHVEHLKCEVSEDEADVEHEQRELLEDFEIENQGLTDEDVKQEDFDPLTVSNPVDNIETTEMADEDETEKEGAENMKTEEYEGADTADTCLQALTEEIDEKILNQKNTEKPRTRQTDIEEGTPSRSISSNVLQTNKKATNNDKISKKHLKTNTKEKPFECEICNVRFSRKYDLNKHLLTHTGEKPFGCEICNVRFTQKGSLNRHLIVHTGEKPFECEICKVRFNLKDNLKVHLLTHTVDKLFECKICKVRFRRNCSLKIHLRTHTAEKPYQCDGCKVRFNQKPNLIVHLRKYACGQTL